MSKTAFDYAIEEIGALDELIKARNALPAPVDDDFPRAKHRYDGAVRVFLQAAANNNHEMPRKNV